MVVSVITLLRGDCLEAMPTLAAGSVDAIIADLPYGTTACKWDTVIPLAPLWAEYRRVLKPKGVVVLFSSQPFTSALVMSNIEWFRYELIWEKNRPTGFLDAKRKPLKAHENLVVFYGAQPTYNPIKTLGKKNNSSGIYTGRKSRDKSDIYHGDSDTVPSDMSGMKYPRSIVQSDGIPPSSTHYHPTQKPVALLEYLIRTYTNEDDTVLDNTMGSGTTGVACVCTGRSFIGIELDSTYFAIAKKRINDTLTQLPLLQETTNG